MIYHVVATVSPGFSVEIQSSDTPTSTTGKLRQLVAWAPRPFKYELEKIQNGVVLDGKLVAGALAGDTWIFDPYGGFYYVANRHATGFTGFRVIATNLDSGSVATDVHVTFLVDEI